MHGIERVSPEKHPTGLDFGAAVSGVYCPTCATVAALPKEKSSRTTRNVNFNGIFLRPSSALAVISKSLSLVAIAKSVCASGRGLCVNERLWI